MTFGESKDNLSALLHGQDVDTVENVEGIYERAAISLLSRIDPIDTIRVSPLAQVIHDDIYNYSLPSDFFKLIDLYPQDNRNPYDTVTRKYAQPFDLRRALRDKEISIESNNGTKYARINWRSRKGKLLHSMDSVTANGTWSAVGTATNIAANSIFKVTGNASIEFDLVTTGDGIKNSTMNAIDLTDESEVSDVFVWVYFGSVSGLTSVTARWGNDLTTKYWTSTAQTTQADGTAFKSGWNLLKFSWSSATQTGTVAPSTVDSFQITFAITGSISNVRVDNIIFSIGRNFDVKYYSKYIFKNTSGTWLSKPASDSDVIVLDNDALQLYNQEVLIAASQQMQDQALSSDVTLAKKELLGEDLRDKNGLYAKYRKNYPSQAIKIINSYGGSPARGRW